MAMSLVARGTRLLAGGLFGNLACYEVPGWLQTGETVRPFEANLWALAWHEPDLLFARVRQGSRRAAGLAVSEACARVPHACYILEWCHEARHERPAAGGHL